MEICLVEVSSGEVINFSNHLRQDREPAWSGDGREIAFVSNRDGNDNIYRMAVDGTGLTRLTTEFTNREPAWSPDGKTICFVSNRPEPFFGRMNRWLSSWLADW